MEQETPYLMLIIDEDPKVRQRVIQSLPNFNIRSLETDNGMDALEILENHAIDFIVSNVRMKKMDGVQFIDISRRNHQEIPVIAMVEAEKSDLIIEAFRAGAYDVMTEPGQVEELEGIILSLIDEIEKKRKRTFEFNTVRYFTEEINLKNDIRLVSVTVDHLLSYIRKTQFKDRVSGLEVALYEMIVNAIEHGNLAISDEEKEQALGGNRFRELMESRRYDPRYKDRLVRIKLNYNPVQLTISVHDEGEGFDISKHIDPDKINLLAHSGRGILMSKLYCDELRYNQTGNRVTIVLKSESSPTRLADQEAVSQASSSAHILLVDHDEQTLKYVSTLLSELGYSCGYIAHSAHLNPRLEEENFDLILLSVDMPKVDGLSLLKELKNHMIFRRIPVIMLAWDRNERVLADCFSLGAEDLIEKPINKTILKPRIDSTLTKVKSIRQIGMANEKLQLLNDQLTQQNQVLSLTQKELESKHEQIENDLLLAEQIQNSILSKAYSSESIHTAVCFRPHSIVSGDFYYFGEDNQGGVNIFLGDATGHGVSAAFLTMLVRMALGMTLPELPPAKIMKEINLQLASCVPRGDYMTGALLKVDSRGNLIGCNAGSAACLILRKTGELFSFFNGGGMALGMFEEEKVPYADESLQLYPGDRIVLLTDGVMERRNCQKAAYGIEKTLQSLQQRSQQPLLKLLHSMEKDLDGFAGMGAEDDYTILAIEYLGIPKSNRLFVQA